MDFHPSLSRTEVLLFAEEVEDYISADDPVILFPATAGQYRACQNGASLGPGQARILRWEPPVRSG